MNAKLIASLFVLSALVSACNSPASREPGDKTVGEAADAMGSLEGKLMSFEVIKTVVFQGKGKCLECHSSAKGNSGKVNLETYAETIKNIGEIKSDIEKDIMPKDNPALPEFERGLILKWIEMGAPETSEVEAPTSVEELNAMNGPEEAPEEKPEEKPETSEEQPATIGYESIRTLIFESKAGRCLECHSEATGNKGKVNLETYAETKKNIDDISMQIDLDEMPKEGEKLPKYERDLITKWIEMGAPEKSEEPLPTREPETKPEETPVAPQTLSYETMKTLIFNETAAGRCLECHTEAKGNKGKVNLETYANIKAKLDDISLQVALDEMPKEGAKLPDYEKKVLEAWIELGAPETSDKPLPVKEAVEAPAK